MLGMITWGKAMDKRMVGMKCVGKDSWESGLRLCYKDSVESITDKNRSIRHIEQTTKVVSFCINFMLQLPL
jgi:hypothetical protein